MKTVFVNYEDMVGRRFNGHDLAKWLNKRGDDCNMYVRIQGSPELFVHKIWDNRFFQVIGSRVSGLERRLSLQNILYPPALISRKNIRHADVVHLHLISMDYLNFLEFIPLAKMKPIVLSLHEFSPFTGCCPYPRHDCKKWQTGCFNCSDHKDGLFPLKKDTSAFHWRYKRYVWSKVRPDLVLASRWMMDNVNNSPMFTDCEKHLIPFGLNLEIFRPDDKPQAKLKLGIPEEYLVIMFRALDSPYKGLETIIAALRQLNTKQKICLLTVNGDGLLNEFLGRYRLVEKGNVTDEKNMAELYQAADIFLMPSSQETFGMMAMEAMACGVPSIVTQGVPTEEVTRAPESALSVPVGDAEALCHALETLISDQSMRQKLGARGRELAVDLYDFNTYARRLRELYTHVLSKRQHRSVGVT